MQARFAAMFEAGIAAAGPPGWLDWTLDFRNMLVHRGRRFEFGQFVPRSPTLYGANARDCCGRAASRSFPATPAGPDVEVFLDTPWTLVLTEEAEQTLQGLIGSTKALLETTAERSLDLWCWRRNHPASLPQPAAQWPNGRSTRSTGFNGYAPGTLELVPGMGWCTPSPRAGFTPRRSMILHVRSG